MNTLEVRQRIDAVATSDPERLGYGYSDSQSPWRHDPAIDLPRDAWLAFVDHLRAALIDVKAPRILRIGPTRAGRSNGIDRVLTAIGAEVIVPDGLGHDIGDDGMAANVDCLLLESNGTFDGVLLDWRQYAPRVRRGGVVAIVDRSQELGQPWPQHRVDELVDAIATEVLMPNGVRPMRFGDAASVHVYEQTDGTLSASKSSGPAPRGNGKPPLLGAVGDYALYEWRDLVYAVPAADAPFCPRRATRNAYPVLLVGDSFAATSAVVEAFVAAEPTIGSALDALHDGNVARARALVASIERDHPDLRTALIPCLEHARWNKRLLLALGVIGVFGAYGTRPHEGAALLRQALRLDLVNGPLLRAVATAYLEVLGDEAAARALLEEARAHVRRRNIAEICHRELEGNVLWNYPKLVAQVTGVIEVGAGEGRLAATWTRLDIPHQVFVEGHPKTFAALQRRAVSDASVRRQATCAVVAAEPGPATLHHGRNLARASLLPCHALATVPLDDKHEIELPVDATTLDALLAAGRIDPTNCNLLYIDTEGSELEVLRGATELLRRVDFVYVGVFLHPVYDGAPLPQQIQSYLHEFDDGEGFHLCAFEVSADRARGQAVFRRTKAR